jgi:hypothetical protein
MLHLSGQFFHPRPVFMAFSSGLNNRSVSTSREGLTRRVPNRRSVRSSAAA